MPLCVPHKSVAQIKHFDEEKLSSKRFQEARDKNADEDYYITTSVLHFAASQHGKWLNHVNLPIKYATKSACVLQEMDNHHRDSRDIFCVYQFEKVEQSAICSPFDGISWKIFNEMIGNVEEYYQRLRIPYRLVNIASGKLDNASSKKLGLEAWLPGTKAFSMLASCSNCTDYQARNFKLCFGQSKKLKEEDVYVHTLNATLCATTQLICAILENYQIEKSIKVPEVLKEFMPETYRDEIPFVNLAPVDEEQNKFANLQADELYFFNNSDSSDSNESFES